MNQIDQIPVIEDQSTPQKEYPNKTDMSDSILRKDSPGK